MSVEQLDIETNTIVASKQERLRERQIKTPVAAVIALAEMQILPRPILNIVTGGETVTIIGQITYAEVYDPVGAALRYARAGVDAVSFFTDKQIYTNGLEDLLLVSRGVNRPVICQDFVLNEYHVAEARAAGAAAAILYASILEPDMLRRAVSIAQRWRMSAILQIENETQIEFAHSLSPHVIAIGKPLGGDVEESLMMLERLQPDLPYNTRVMLLDCLHTTDQIKSAVKLGVDAVLVDESLLLKQNIRELVKR